ncbi:MAG: WG repeat-containing protein [Bacteroidota bacterium]
MAIQYINKTCLLSIASILLFLKSFSVSPRDTIFSIQNITNGSLCVININLIGNGNIVDLGNSKDLFKAVSDSLQPILTLQDARKNEEVKKHIEQTTALKNIEAIISNTDSISEILRALVDQYSSKISNANALNEKLTTASIENQTLKCRKGGARILGDSVNRYVLFDSVYIDNSDYTIYTYSEGMAPFKYKNKFGFIDTKGNIVITAQYDSVSAFSKGKAWCKIFDWAYCIDKKNTKLATLHEVESFTPLDQNYCSIIKKTSGVSYLINRDNKIISEGWDLIDTLSCGKYRVGRKQTYGFFNMKFGYIELTEEIDNSVSAWGSTKYVFATNFENNSCTALIGGYDTSLNRVVYYIIDHFEKKITDKYLNIGEFSNDYYKVVDTKTKRTGVIDRKGELKISPIYDSITNPLGGLSMIGSCLYRKLTKDINGNEYILTEDLLQPFRFRNIITMEGVEVFSHSDERMIELINNNLYRIEEKGKKFIYFVSSVGKEKCLEGCN